MRGQDEFHGRLAHALGARRGGVDHHAVSHLGLAGAHGLIGPVDAHHAQTATADRLQIGMLAQMRDEDARVERGVEDGCPLVRLDLLAINRQLHVVPPLSQGFLCKKRARQAAGPDGRTEFAQDAPCARF